FTLFYSDFCLSRLIMYWLEIQDLDKQDVGDLRAFIATLHNGSCALFHCYFHFQHLLSDHMIIEYIENYIGVASFRKLEAFPCIQLEAQIPKAVEEYLLDEILFVCVCVFGGGGGGGGGGGD
ncbi:hypothetical protein ACJX0J_017088, partial [Zea mays]